MESEVIAYNEKFDSNVEVICSKLAELINSELNDAEYKIWHGQPVWFLKGNPIVGYSVQKAGVRLMFWSGKDFEEVGLNKIGGKFKEASIFFNDINEIDALSVNRWLMKSRKIQWDYKNIVKRKGKLVKISPNEAEL